MYSVKKKHRFCSENSHFQTGFPPGNRALKNKMRMEHCWFILREKTRLFYNKPTPVIFCAAQAPHELPWLESVRRQFESRTTENRRSSTLQWKIYIVPHRQQSPLPLRTPALQYCVEKYPVWFVTIIWSTYIYCMVN